MKLITTGEWILILVHFFKQMGYANRNNTDDSNNTSEETFNLHNSIEPKFVFNDWTHFVVWAAFGSYLIYFAVGGFLHVRELLNTFRTFSSHKLGYL